MTIYFFKQIHIVSVYWFSVVIIIIIIILLQH